MNSRLAFLVLPFVGLAINAANAAAQWPSACGPDSQQFKVKTEKTPLGPISDSTKARIVFIESLDGGFPTGPVVRFAVDGGWLAADKGRSFAAIEVPAGEHLLCGSRQSGAKLEKENLAVVKLDAQAGKTYFYNFKIISTETGSPEMATGGIPGSSMTSKPRETVDTVEFRPVDEDAGLTIIKKLPQSASAPK